MKDMKLSVKLIGGFSIVAAITLIVGLIGFWGVAQTDNALTDLDENSLPSVAALQTINEAQTAVDAAQSMLLVPEVFSSSADRARENKEIADAFGRVDKAWKIYAPLPQSKEEAAIWKAFVPAWEAWKKDSQRFDDLIKAGQRAEALSLAMGKMRVSFDLAEKHIDELVQINIKNGRESGDRAMAQADVARILVVAGMLIGFIAALLLGIFLSRSITKPINRVVAGLTDGADQVASAASQVSSASQSLAEGSSEQAASLEETSSSMEEMSSMTKQNADNAGQAKAMMVDAKNIVEKVSGHMDEMSMAIVEITKSSEETSKIIKTIDEIAFQTNLLALNAAVEAARAGEAGAGFAVVADEVRNLAMRAAEAAKSTNTLIENTIKAVKNGNELTQKTQEAFKENITISGKISQLIDEIATASTEQAHGISEVGTAINEMNGVTQQTAANAEESASASEELNAQAEQMKIYVAELSAVVGGSSAAQPISKSERSEHKQMPAASKPQGKALKAIAAPVKQGKVTFTRAKAVNPEKIIPMGEGKFKDF